VHPDRIASVFRGTFSTLKILPPRAKGTGKGCSPGRPCSNVSAESGSVSRREPPRGGCPVGDGGEVAAAARPKERCPAARGSRETPAGQDVLRAAAFAALLWSAFRTGYASRSVCRSVAVRGRRVPPPEKNPNPGRRPPLPAHPFRRGPFTESANAEFRRAWKAISFTADVRLRGRRLPASRDRTSLTMRRRCPLGHVRFAAPPQIKPARVVGD
jgi:hypothetical protein